MTKIRKIFTALLVSCLFFVASSFTASNAFAAARLFLDPASGSPAIGTDVQENVKVDTGGSQIFGADATINYPSDSFTVKSVTYGSFFTDNVAPIQNSGQIILRGSFFSSISGLGSGTGTFATITFTALKAGGTATVGFDCSGSDIIDSNGGNVLSCGSLNTATFSFTTGATPTPTPAPGSTTPPTNACGGTCGSVYNCNTGLFCYQGFCRNPDCPSSSTCGCTSPTPTSKPTIKPTIKPTPTGTPAVLTLAKTTPFPTFGPAAEISPTPLAAVPQSSFLKPVYVWAVLGIIALIVILIAIRALRRGRPPKFTPPTTNVPPTFPTNPPPASPPVMPPTSY